MDLGEKPETPNRSKHKTGVAQYGFLPAFLFPPMSIFSNSEDPAAADKGALPADQQKRANEARPQVDTAATEAGPGTPQYGDFGNPNNVTATSPAPNNDGSNDNPDEFSEFRKPGEASTEDYGTTADAANPDHQQGHVEQNQDPQAVRAVQNADADAQKVGWAKDDERYAGGHRPASWEESNEKEHSND
jgi:hypothetical protein